jgi:alcohol dehydrogenase class IV
MNSFSFETTPSIRCGSGISRDIATLVAPVLGQRVLIVTDAGIRKVGLLAPIEGNLRAAGFEVTVYDDVAADPPEANILGAVELAKEMRVTGVLGIGGGSPMDEGCGVARG